MISLKQINKRVASVLGTALLISGVALPAAFPVMASAASLDSRSITMSSSAVSDTAVTYDFNATINTTISSGGGIVFQFCSNSPLVGLTCTAPAGLDASNVTLATGSSPNVTPSQAYASGSASGTANVVTWTASANASAGKIAIGLQNITNPSSEGTFYVRVLTYKDSTDLASYANATAPAVGDTSDTGGVALSIVKKISVKAYVQESLSFCVSHTAPGSNCGGTIDDPSLLLGQETSPGSGVYALDTTNPSTGDDYAQVNTNAAHGATVNLHSSTVGCGGLIRVNDGTNCDITAQNSAASTVAGGDAKFGLELANPVAVGGGSPTGTITPVANYQGQYFIDYVDGDATGVTSTYGSPLFSSDGPTSDYNVKMTIAASAAPATPAGIYSADLMLVATGTF